MRGCPHIFKAELTDKGVPLHLRMRLFNATVTPTVLYGAGSWVMTASMDERLQSVQLKMVRRMMGRPRRYNMSTGELETWVEWLQEATHDARAAMAANRVKDWVGARKVRLCQWKRKLQGMSCDRWAVRVLNWQPSRHRLRGRPRLRWTDQPP